MKEKPGQCSSCEQANSSQLILQLERRITALEQPVWTVSAAENRWRACTKGPCKCRPQTQTLTCWRSELGYLPPLQTVPSDVRLIDCGINHLSTLHKDAFKQLGNLSELDLFDNKIDYLPDLVFEFLLELRYLKLHRNRLRDIPSEMFINLSNLETL
ncbi:leucine-rich repeat-containing protein 3C-like [Bacillus rossius redtenbacheri]|uniref:leucine-rich repeat-containing protein 3C-like n=1 Tax=Bacillus rossius redtenbacheri TaxID=93214 RepID=UPI002FDD4810